MQECYSLITLQVKVHCIRCREWWTICKRFTYQWIRDSCQEKTLTDYKLLDRIYKGGNIIAKGFIDEIPRSKLKEGNDLITKNTLLIKVIK